MSEPTTRRERDEHRILVRSEPPGVRLVVHGPLDDEGGRLLTEVVHAALLTVGRAHRIHLDLSHVSTADARLPRLVQRVVRAGATVTTPTVRRRRRATAWSGVGAAR